MTIYKINFFLLPQFVTTLVISLLIANACIGQDIGIAKADSLLGHNITLLTSNSYLIITKDKELFKRFLPFKIACLILSGDDTAAISVDNRNRIVAIHQLLPYPDSVLKDLNKKYKEPYSYSSFHIPGAAPERHLLLETRSL